MVWFIEGSVQWTPAYARRDEAIATRIVSVKGIEHNNDQLLSNFVFNNHFLCLVQVM